MTDLMRSTTVRRWLDTVSQTPGAPHYLLASAFFIVVFCLIPFSLYAHSGEDWGFPFYSLLWMPALGAALCFASLLVIRLLATLSKGAARAAACLLFCVGVLLLVAHVYAPIQIGPLDGSEIVSDEPGLYTALEMAVVMLLVFAFLQLRRGRGVTAAVWFSLTLLIVSIGYATVLAWPGEGQVKPSVAAAAASSLADIDGNVYHIVLDRMQTDAFLRALEQSSRTDQFEGFQLFKNNISNYISTIPSSASYLTGRLFIKGNYKEWVREWQDVGLIPTLAEHGYRTWIFAPFPHWKSKHADHFYYNIAIYEEETGIASAGLHDLIQIWAASLVPNALTNEALPVAAALGDSMLEQLTGKPGALSIAKGVDPYAGMLMLRKLRREERLRAPDGEYVYAHAALPHPPFVLDRHCNYIGRQKSTRGAYLLQSQCAINLVAEFLRELKRLERYDAATVIVHGDTGAGVGGIDGKTRPAGSRTLGVSDIGLTYTLNALLMIKRPHARDPLEIVDTPTQLIDLFPTILDILGLKPSYRMHGKSVYALRPDERREARFGFDPQKKMNGPNIVQVRIEDPLDLKHSRFTVIGPVTNFSSERSELQ